MYVYTFHLFCINYKNILKYRYVKFVVFHLNMTLIRGPISYKLMITLHHICNDRAIPVRPWLANDR